MTSYLDDLDRVTPAVPVDERVIGALSPRLLELARDRAAGTHTYAVTPEHTAWAREVVGPDKVVAPYQAVLLETDRARARERAREYLGPHLPLGNYLNSWRRMGFGEADFAAGGSDRLVDSLVAWGEPARIADHVRAHHDAGADHVCLELLAHPTGMPARAGWRIVADALEL